MATGKIILPIEEMPIISSVDIPMQFYTVLQFPAPLAGMCHPNHIGSVTFMQLLAFHGFPHIICLTDENPGYSVGTLNRLGATQLEDLYGGLRPKDDQVERGKILEMSHLAVNRLQCGQGVVVHCGAGIGRTGTVLGAILIELGNDPARVVDELTQFNRARGSRWPKSQWQKELLLSLKA